MSDLIFMKDPRYGELRVDVYSVGLLRDLQHWWRFRKLRPKRKRPMGFGHLWRKVRRRQWRSIKSSFNGYLAEPTPFPMELKRCGSGWSRARALRDLRRRLNNIPDPRVPGEFR